MSLMSGLSTALLVAWPSLVSATASDTTVRVAMPIAPVSTVAVPLLAAAGDTTLPATASDRRTEEVLALARPAALSSRRDPGTTDAVDQDTVPRRRAKAVVYSDGYGKRLALHKTLSWAMLPLFAVSYLSGDQLIQKGSDAPDWAQSVHPIAATSTAVLFGVNAVTGGWNLWEGRSDPNGRVKRFVHSALFMVASGGFAYTGSKLAEDAQENRSSRNAHRNMAVASMGVSTASWLIMLIGN
jgi:hypothetical protein